MTSINNYPARKQEQVFTCDAIALVIGDDSNKPFSHMVFYDKTVEYESGGGWSAHEKVFYQSRYPAYVTEDNDGNPCLVMFSRNPKDFRMIINWTCDTNSSDPLALPHNYLYNLSCLSPYDMTNDPPSVPRAYTRTELDSEYKLSWPSGEYLESVGRYLVPYHIGNLGQVVKLYGPRSSWGGPNSQEVRCIASVRPTYNESGGLFYSTYITEPPIPYRILHGMPFQSGQDWLAWCKAH